MLRIPPTARLPLRILAGLMSAALFGYLIWQAGPSKLWENVLKLGWGFVWVLALAGISHVVKTWAWRLTLDDHKIRFLFYGCWDCGLERKQLGNSGLLDKRLEIRSEYRG